jgi:pullulanase/glycogen debranching enzyme
MGLAWKSSMDVIRCFAMGLLAVLAGIDAGTAAASSSCDAAAFDKLLRPALETTSEARGVWLDASSLQWPGVSDEGRFKLYGSQRGELVAKPGDAVRGADGVLPLRPRSTPLATATAERFRYLKPGVVLELAHRHRARVAALLRGQVLLVQEDAQGRVLRATGTQMAAALDALYAGAQAEHLGVEPRASGTRFSLWAPTAQHVALCLYPHSRKPASREALLRRDAHTGAWSVRLAGDLSGSSYAFLVDVFVPGVGIARNRVTDPYSVSLNADSKRSFVARLDAAVLKPPQWDATPAPQRVQAPTDMVIYELHVRDFSIGDPSVSPAHRGKYLAFTEDRSDGMRHLKALADAGLTDVHLMPVFDFATVPERACVTPQPQGPPDGASQQVAVAALKVKDCFNWGYDPLHYNAPEGSYATDPEDGARRIVEFRQMVQALHRAGLRVGMDVVYNHTSASGQRQTSVLDRIVPGYYHRLDEQGRVERSTCCDNTATEHLMMGKLLIDSVLQWAREYRIDSFRFDLMAHQPRALMQTLQRRLREETGREIPLIGEGWNFGEVADGVRFVQASQLSLNGSGIGTFSDRARDAVRGGGPSDPIDAWQREQGWINGLFYDPTPQARATREDLLHAADMVRVGLAGTLRSFPLETASGEVKALEHIDYHGQPAGYASQPSEVVNYVENHDNLTLFDNDVLKLPQATSREDRARVQLLGASIVAFSQGIAYFHAGIDTLRSKSMDRNSFDSGDWFNRLDWRYRDNNFGVGLPPKADNGDAWPLLKPLLADASIKPGPDEIAWMRDAFRDLLRIRASSSLFHLRSADDVEQRLHFLNTGPAQEPTVIALLLDGHGYPGAAFGELLVLINVDRIEHALRFDALRGQPFELHPVLQRADAADARARQARFDSAGGGVVVPARTAVVYVVN